MPNVFNNGLFREDFGHAATLTGASLTGVRSPLAFFDVFILSWFFSCWGWGLVMNVCSSQFSLGMVST